MPDRPRPVMAGREMVNVADLNGCSLCGIPEAVHGEVFGLGHLGVRGKRFYGPSESLLARRRAARLEPSTGLPYGAFNPGTGTPLTHLVQAACRCGSVTMVTPERADGARCSGCLHTDVLEKGTSRA